MKAEFEKFLKDVPEPEKSDYRRYLN